MTVRPVGKSTIEALVVKAAIWISRPTGSMQNCLLKPRLVRSCELGDELVPLQLASWRRNLSAPLAGRRVVDEDADTFE